MTAYRSSSNSDAVDTSIPLGPSAQPVSPGAQEAQPGRLARVARSGWVLPSHVAVIGLAAFVYVFNLTVSGYANTFYAMAAQAASQDWAAWFWGSLDSSNFITVDKPPLATMLMGLSVRVFGLSSWSILLPEALCGVATIAVLYAIVRRSVGPVAATIAAVVATLTPAAVLMFRYDNPDALLTLLLVVAAWAFMRAISDGRLRWVVLAALLVGLAFNTKFLQAYLVLPAFAVVYAIAAPGSVRKRAVGLVVAAVSVVVFSSWWVLAVQFVPAGMRPYVGGSTDGSAVNLLFGYDGFGRILGFGGPGPGSGGPGAPAPGASFSGEPGLLRLFNAQLGGQVGWLLPFAAIGAVSSLVLRLRRPRTDPARAAVLMWTLWLVVHALVFSLMSGINHSYYAVVMAPAIGALVGTGTVDLWRARRAHPRFAGTALTVAIGASALLAWHILERTPDFLPGLATVVLVAGVAAAVVVAAVSWLPGRLVVTRVARAAGFAAAMLGIVAALAGPTAYTAQTMATAYGGGDPAAGPITRAALGSFPGAFPGTPGPPGGTGGPGGIGGPTAPIVGGTFANRNPGGLTPALLDYLVANRGSARWIVAASSSNEAAPIQLATGQPVMAMGGFNGADPAPTLDQLKAFIASGELRFVVATAAGFGSFGLGFGSSTGISAWVRANCSPLDLTANQANNVYDCAGAV
jgi:4-amino-4-deoxy-L-arabinose transferase-like glycosyltransferase